MGENAGKCLCGEVIFQVTGDLVMHGNCHCTDCKKKHRSGIRDYTFFQGLAGQLFER